MIFKPKSSDFLLDLRRSFAHKGFAKILDVSRGMPAVFANPYASRFQHISSQNVCLQAVSLGLGALIIGTFYDDRVKTVIHAMADERPLYIMPIGRLKK